MNLAAINVTQQMKNELLRRFLDLPEVTGLREDIEYFSLLVSLGIHQEIGTIHDELAVFLYDAETGRRVEREKMRSEIVRCFEKLGRPTYGVRIWVEGVTHIEPRVRGLRSLTHPNLSYDADGKLFQLVFFPLVIVEIAAYWDAELVAVKPWGLNTIFGGFDPRRSYYEANLWELVNTDVLRYARLLEKRQFVFWGTHDLVSHIAGLKTEKLPELESRGKAIRQLLEQYFENVPKPNPASLVIPYTLGLLLDDLAQPVNYESQTRKRVIELLVDALEKRAINPATTQYLLKYPPSIERLIAVARSNDIARTARDAQRLVTKVISEIHKYSVQSTGR